MATTTAGDLRAEILAEHAQYLAALAGLDVQTLETAPVLGVWPFHDLTAHLTGWIDALLASDASGLGGPEPAWPLITDFDRFNASSVEGARDLPWSEVVSALDAAVERAAREVAALTEQQIATEIDFPWGPRGSVGRLLAIIPRHHHEHRKDIERWHTGGR